MLVFSITLTQKRLPPPVWIILVLAAKLDSVSALLVKGPDPSNLPSTLKLVCVRVCCLLVLDSVTSKLLSTAQWIRQPKPRDVCDVPSLLHAHTKTKFRKGKHKFSRTHIDGTHTHTNTHTHTHTHTHSVTHANTNTETHAHHTPSMC